MLTIVPRVNLRPYSEWENTVIMRLKHIKLAGFKSFVDATTVHFPSDLVAIVGPNGCGKSNIIDAVRWVMGESSAKQLRGESMADVIFNGSSARQPLAHAMVELTFDNSDGSLGGEYAQYSEIAVRREVSLDGQSTYCLNGSRCRRRDITDIFLGTGLGPRSYAIIKQDTISRIIEAKPEELRVYLEEAAGISKYKERRKETETRMQHTRENLQRLDDVRAELAKQLEHLERQAQAAEKYKAYKEQETLLKAQLHALHWRGFDTALQQQRSALQHKENSLEAIVTAQRATEAALEKQRQVHSQIGEEFGAAQEHYYHVGADITRLEQSLQHGRERRQQLESDQQQTEQDWQALQGHLHADKEKTATLQQRITVLQPLVSEANVSAQHANTAVSDAQTDLAVWQEQWDTFTHATAALSQKAEVNKTRLVHTEDQLQQTKQRSQRLQQELAQCDSGENNVLPDMEQRVQQEEQQLQQQQQHLLALQERLSQQRQHNVQHEQQLAQARTQLQALQGQHASLSVLQQAALGRRDKSVVDWLSQQQLQDNPRLAQRLRVAAGWERAVETVLGDNVQAVCVESIDDGICRLVEKLTQGTVCLLATAAAQIPPGAEGDTLASKVEGEAVLSGWLSHIYVAEDLPAALDRARQLAPHESVITASGIWLGRNWLRVAHDIDEKGSVLQRERELSAIAEGCTTQQQQVEAIVAQLAAGRAQQQALEGERDVQQVEINQATQLLAKTRSEWRIQAAKQEQLQKRQQQLTHELAEQQQLLQDAEQRYATIRSDWQQAVSELTDASQQREPLQQAGQMKREALRQLQQQRQQAVDAAHQYAMELESLTSQHDAILRNDERMQQHLTQLIQKREQVARALQESIQPLVDLEQALALQLQQRLHAAATMDAVRQRLGAVEEELTALEQTRQQADATIQALRQDVERARLDLQTVSVRQMTIEEQLQESEFALETLLQQVSEVESSAAWEEKLGNLQVRIQRLGAINLAAIDECTVLRERKAYLEQQNADLLEALLTLENAIGKIDHETRVRFKHCLQRVNDDFQRLFPRIFAGGHAELELTEDNLLKAGVLVKAMPPGKRNSSVHLLSGGEKALTALALVFAIFQLNPAPFCMLDEVDAPLDDANVIRFSNLVKDMSDKVQFIFITHNKVTMEMAHHLLGVTMNEPGVSRLVSVDVEDALALAEA